MVRQTVVPALERVATDRSIHTDIRGGALIALARCGGSKEHVQVLFEAARVGSGEGRIVRESAILALGILQRKSPEIRAFLIDLVDNQDVQSRARCFAAISLGLLKDSSPEVFACLERCLNDPEATPDVPVSALLSIGLIGDATRVPTLIGWLREGRIGRNRLSDLRRAYVVAALGKIGDPGALKAVAAALREKGIHTRRSAMIALGQIVPLAEPRVQLEYLQKLVRCLRTEGDVSARNFGLISIGRIGGHPEATEPVRSAGVSILIDRFRNGRKTTERPYAALALGLVCFESGPDVSKPPELKYRLAGLVRSELAKMKGDQVALGAQAISLGMIGDSDQITLDLLGGILDDRSLHRKLRGCAAVALGLIGDRNARTAIVKALREREDRGLRIDTAVAAGLLGDASAVPELVKVLTVRDSSQFVLGCVAMALGQIGDDRAIPSLIAILEPGRANGSFPDMTRALVSVSLGQLANRRNLGVLYRISKDINYLASVSALEELLTIL